MLICGTVSADNYENLNVCYIGIGSTQMTHCNFGKRCILLLIETVKWLYGP